MPRTSRCAAFALVGALAIVHIARADDAAWVIEPSAEAPDAAKSGAPEVARAQQLAKAKDYLHAVETLEHVARAWPAAVHDCNLSLAYLRAGALTRAQLMWDVAGLRNAARPSWCTGSLSTQVSTALHAAGYVPVTIDVVPSDAIVELGGVAVRGIHVVWLPPGRASVTAHAPDRTDQSLDVTVAAPSTRVAITLAAPPSAGAEVATVTPPAVDSPRPPVATPAPVEARPAPVVPAPRDPAPRSRVPLVVSGAVAALGWGGAIAFGLAASSARTDANAHYVGDPAFADARDRFSRDRTLSFAAAGVGALATGYLVYLLVRHDDRPHAAYVAVTPTGEGALVTVGGAL